MKRILFMICFGVMLLPFAAVRGQAQESSEKIKVGVYDNRAIALAYFRSEHNPFIAKREEMLKAQESKDSAKIAELNDWLVKFQKQMHFQGFCRAPVDDLLLVVKDKLAEVAKNTGVDFIGWYPDYTGAQVETVDITQELVLLFEPPAEKMDEIMKIIDVEPVALSDIKDDD